MNIFLTYEPGYRWFKGTGHTSPQYGVPSDTYEGRIHFRVRTDAMTRNLMELPHAGVTLGGDIFYGHRAKWVAWGGPPFDTPDFKQERTYLSMSGYVLAATGLPLLNSDKHRLVASLHGGIGKDLDRFSTFRLPGRPTGYEWDAVALPMIHGVAFNELMPRHYAIANVQYRYEALFFCTRMSKRGGPSLSRRDLVRRVGSNRSRTPCPRWVWVLSPALLGVHRSNSITLIISAFFVMQTAAHLQEAATACSCSGRRN